MSKQIELLSPPTNYAVVQLPERNFPGVVVQGDTLNALMRQTKRMSKLLSAGQVDELAAELLDMSEQLSEAVTQYESICGARGLPLPY
jgi:hypothetical protein